MKAKNICPKCGLEMKDTEFCSGCNTRAQTANKSKRLRAFTVILAVLLIVSGGWLIVGGTGDTEDTQKNESPADNQTIVLSDSVDGGEAKKEFEPSALADQNITEIAVPKYDSVKSFSEGLAWVKRDGKQYFLIIQ